MNLVEVAKYIQEGYRKYYYIKKTEGQFDNSIHGFNDCHQFVIDHVMKLGRGGFNPKTLKYLVELETSVSDENGMI